MDKDQIIHDLNPIFQRIFNAPDLMVHDTLNAEQVSGWDSLTHLTMIAEVEAHFGVKFKLKELIGMKHVGDMIDLIITKKSV
jgi:acyl carrier protein